MCERGFVVRQMCVVAWLMFSSMMLGSMMRGKGVMIGEAEVHAEQAATVCCGYRRSGRHRQEDDGVR